MGEVIFDSVGSGKEESVVTGYSEKGVHVGAGIIRGESADYCPDAVRTIFIEVHRNGSPRGVRIICPAGSEIAVRRIKVPCRLGICRCRAVATASVSTAVTFPSIATAVATAAVATVTSPSIATSVAAVSTAVTTAVTATVVSICSENTERKEILIVHDKPSRERKNHKQ